MKKNILFIFSFLCFTMSCKELKEKKYSDVYGNVFVEKGNELSIIPAKYKKKGKSYKIFIFNETKNDIGIINDIKIKPNKFIVVSLVDTSKITLDNGVQFSFGETNGLEVVDKSGQVSGLGGEYLKKYKVPDKAEWAFVIVPKGEGD